MASPRNDDVLATRSHGVLLDLDGTLVDSVYQHVVAWFHALYRSGYDIPQWRIHSGIGMGSARLVPWLLGRPVEPDEVEELAGTHRECFLQQAEALRPTPGARELLSDLDARGITFRIATSAGSEEGEALLDALGTGDPGTVEADEVCAPKPAEDLLMAAARELRFSPDRMIMVGDSPWDAEAAHRAGMRSIAVRCGGFADETLRGLGAADVVDDPSALIGRL